MSAQRLTNFEQSILFGSNLSLLKKSEPLKTAEQIRSDWLLKRIGKFTASDFNKLTTCRKKTELPVGAITYITQKAVEELTEHVDDGYVSESMQWGLDQESKGIAEFEKQTSLKVTRTGKDQKFIGLGSHIGGTPDGLIDGISGIEIKCPNSTTHFKHVSIKNAEDLKTICPDYYWQVQGLMFITGCKNWYFVSYDPRFTESGHRLHIVFINANIEDQLFLSERLRLAVEHKTKLLKDFGVNTDKEINQDTVLKVLCIGRTKLWELRKANMFPEPVNKNPLRWRSSDIDNFAMS